MFYWIVIVQVQIRFAVEKIFVSPSKNASNFHMWELYDKHFFFKKRKHGFISSPDCFITIKQPQILVYNFFQQFFEIVRKLNDKHFSIDLTFGIV